MMSVRFNRTHTQIAAVLMILILGVAPLLSLTTSCGWTGEKVKEKVKGKAADEIEDRAVKLGIDLKKKYAIDVEKDSVPAQIMKIVHTEIKSGNTELAGLVADLEKVKSLNDALVLVANFQAAVESGKLSQEAADAAGRTAKGLGGLAALFAAAGGWGWLRGKGMKAALVFLAERIEKAAKDGLSADQVKELARNPNLGEEAAATILAKVVKERFPVHFKKAA